MNASRKLVAVALSTALLATPQIGMAFKLPGGLGGGGNASENSGGGDAVAQQDQLLRAYVAADKDVLKAQARMADALGMKDRAAKLNAVSDALGEGATKDSLQESETMQSEASKEIQAKLKDNNTQLDAEGKKKYAEALGSLGRGVRKYSQLKGPMQAFQSSVTNAGAAGALQLASKIGVGKFILTTMPSNLTNLTGTLNGAIAFAKSHDIPVPADATAAL